VKGLTHKSEGIAGSLVFWKGKAGSKTTQIRLRIQRVGLVWIMGIIFVQYPIGGQSWGACRMPVSVAVIDTAQSGRVGVVI
jgi:hypothetical protein